MLVLHIFSQVVRLTNQKYFTTIGQDSLAASTQSAALLRSLFPTFANTTCARIVLVSWWRCIFYTPAKKGDFGTCSSALVVKMIRCVCKQRVRGSQSEWGQEYYLNKPGINWRLIRPFMMLGDGLISYANVWCTSRSGMMHC